MATVTKTFVFESTAESFAGTPGAATTMSYDSGTGNPAGALKSRIYGKNKTNTNYWELSGITWEDLGVPSGATVTYVRIYAGYTRCTEYTTGASSSAGAYTFRDSAGTTVIATVWTGRTFTAADGSWVAISEGSDVAVGSSYQASTTSIRIRLANSLNTGNSNSAAVSLYDDQVSFVITYTITYNLTIAETAHVHTVDSPTLTQLHILDIDETAHVHTVDSPDLTQLHILVIAESAHAHTVDNLVLEEQAPAIDLVIAECAHVHTVDSLELSQLHILTVQESAHTHAVDSLELTQVHVLAVDGSAHAHTVDSLELTQVHILVIAETAHVHSADNVVLEEIPSGSINLVIQEASHSHTAEGLSLTQVHVLALSDGAHPLTSENVSLTQVHILVASDSAHSQTSENVTLTQVHVLTIADSAHGHTGDNVVLTLGGEVHNLLINSGTHGHTVDSLTLQHKQALFLLVSIVQYLTNRASITESILGMVIYDE